MSIINLYNQDCECFKDINIDDYKTEVSYLIPKSKEIVEDLEVSWR